MLKKALSLVFALLLVIPVLAEAGGSVKGKVSVAGAKNSGDVVVYLEGPAAGAAPAKHPALDQKNLIFVPHVLAVMVGSTVDFQNGDDVLHNIFSPSEAKTFNLGTYGKGTKKEVVFDKVGEVALLCNVHAEMSAYVIVVPNQFFATTGADGSFSIDGVPAGSYTLKTWADQKKPKTEKVTVTEGGAAAVNISL
jgi:plastocyanin